MKFKTVSRWDDLYIALGFLLWIWVFGCSNGPKSFSAWLSLSYPGIFVCLLEMSVLLGVVFLWPVWEYWTTTPERIVRFLVWVQFAINLSISLGELLNHFFCFLFWDFFCWRDPKSIGHPSEGGLCVYYSSSPTVDMLDGKGMVTYDLNQVFPSSYHKVLH